MRGDRINRFGRAGRDFKILQTQWSDEPVSTLEFMGSHYDDPQNLMPSIPLYSKVDRINCFGKAGMKLVDPTFSTA